MADDLKKHAGLPRNFSIFITLYHNPCDIRHGSQTWEDTFVDWVQGSSHKLVIQFQGQTDKSMQKNILNEFVKPNSKSHLHLRD